MLGKYLKAVFDRRANRQTAKRSYRPWLEALEDRTLLSTFTWNWKMGNNNWSTKANWIKVGKDLGDYPGQSVKTDVVNFNNTSNNSCNVDVGPIIATLTIDANYTSTVSISTGNTLTIGDGQNPPATASSMAAGTLGGPGPLVISALVTFAWTGGTLVGPGPTNNTGTMTISGGNDKTLDNSRLQAVGGGTITWQDSGNIILKNYSNINISSGSKFIAKSPSAIKDIGGGAFVSVFFLQQSVGAKPGGELDVTPGAGATTTMNVFFSTALGTNTNVQTGTLLVNFGSDLNGTATISGAATLTLSSQDPKMDKLDGVTITGTGTLYFLGHISVVANSTLSVNSTVDQSGTLDGAGTLTIGGAYDWYGYGPWTDSGQMKILSGGGALSIDRPFDFPYSLGRTVDNYGIVTWSSTARDISVTNGATIHNENGATFTIAVDNNILNNRGGFFINAGLLQKTAASGTTRIDLLFAGGNTGTIDVKSGKLQINLLMLNLGIIIIEAPQGGMVMSAGFEQDSGSTSLTSNSTITVPAGNLVQKGGTITLQAPGAKINVTGQYQESGGTTTVYNFASISVTDQYVESGGTVDIQSGSITATNGFQVLSGAVLQGLGSITASTLTNSGTIDPGETNVLGGIGITGNYTQTSGGVLNEDMAWNGSNMVSDNLGCSGQASLHGTLNVTLLQSPPPIHVSTNLMGWGSLIGTFDTANIPAGWKLIYNPTYLEILKVS